MIKAIAMAASWFSFIAAATCFKYFVKHMQASRVDADIIDYLLFWFGLAFGLAAISLSIIVVMA